MKVRVLGCSGGIGGNSLRTTCLAVDDDILIDAGTGAGDLSLEELTRIDHIFITHSHLDHIACLLGDAMRADDHATRRPVDIDRARPCRPGRRSLRRDVPSGI